MNPSPIQLDRRFWEISPGDKNFDPDKFEFFSSYLMPPGVGWERLLTNKCTVVLGEAGSGKTTEFRQRATILRERGRMAFFIPVKELAAEGELADALTAPDKLRLSDWKDDRGAGDAFFFLDAVDDARLNDSSVFERALRHFANGIDPETNRAKVLISCRISDWRPTSDPLLIDRIFTQFETAPLLIDPNLTQVEAPPPKDKKPYPVIVFLLLPLDDERIERLSSHYGAEDPGAFLRAVSDAGVRPFAGRPLDVEWMVAHWREKKRLGPLRDLIDYNIRRKIKDRVERKPTLPDENVRQDAQRLALAAVLTGKTAFALRDDPADERRAADTIDPRRVIADRTASQLTDVLSRGLFDEATYGRVRFHHRMVREYLAARQIHQLLADGLPRREINRLLFRQTVGGPVVPPHLMGTTGWLSLWDANIRDRVILHAPEILIDGGDSAGLSGDDRATVLRAYAEKFRRRRWSDFSFDRPALLRFATSNLSPAICEILRQNESEEVRITLLRIVEEGSVSGCANVAFEIARDRRIPVRIRGAAVSAVGVVGTSPQKRRLLRILDDETIRDHAVAAPLIHAFFPDPLNIAKFIRLLTVVEPRRWNRLTDFTYYLEHDMPKRCSQEQRLAVIDGIRDLLESAVTQSPSGVRNLNSGRGWLISPLCAWLPTALDAWGDQDALPVELDRALWFLRSYVRYRSPNPLDNTDDVVKAIAKKPLLRRHLFWREVENIAEQKKGVPRYPYLLPDHGLFGIGVGDTGWLEKDARENRDELKRSVAFDALMNMDFRPEVVELVDRLADSDPVWQTRLDEHRNEQSRLRSWGEDQRREREKIDDREPEKDSENRNELLKRLQGLSAGKDFQALEFIYANAGQSRRHYGEILLDEIEKKYGKAISDAAHEGFRRFWRDTEPNLPHEQAQRNSTPIAMVYALVGLNLDHKNGVALPDMEIGLLRKAIKIGTWEINQFPTWFEGIVEKVPELVREILAPTIRAEYDFPENSEPNIGVLYRISGSSTVFGRAFSPLLREMLSLADPPRPDSLQAALDVVEGPDSDVSFADAFFKDRCKSNLHRHSHFALWWKAWAVRAPRAAVDFLEKALSKVAFEGGRNLMVELCYRFEMAADERRARIPATLGNDLDAIARLYPLVIKFVRPEDDAVHDGEGAYHVGPREFAERFRNRLFGWLGSNRDERTYEMIQGLADRRELAAFRDGLLNLADRWAWNSAPCVPLSENQAVDLCTRFTVPPDSPQDLFEIAKDRLDDIRLDVENGRHSIRASFQSARGTDADVKESELQTLIAHDLEKSSRGYYTVHREQEFDRKKKPDICLHNSSVNGIVAIEVKVADNWRLKQLTKGLSDQLVGHYLRNESAAHGIYLLCSVGNKRHWKLAPETSLDFGGLVKHLNELAGKIQAEDNSVKGLVVIGINFH
jgi:hypothetical protein